MKYQKDTLKKYLYKYAYPLSPKTKNSIKNQHIRTFLLKSPFIFLLSFTIFPYFPTSWAPFAHAQSLKLQAKKCATPPPKGMVCIPGGYYYRGSDRNKENRSWKLRAESPRHRVWLQTFYVDKYEITNEQYIACMKAGHCPPPTYWAQKNGSMWKRFRTMKRPFVRATWYLAYAYCHWAGKRLLTEAEWEAAARGPKGWTYPWGNKPPTCKLANYRVYPPHTSYPRPISKMRFCPNPRSHSTKLLRYGQDQTWEVGSTRPWRGIYDMAGNGYEWVQDFYDPHAYAGCDNPNDKSCERINPKGPCQGKYGKKCVVYRKKIWYWKRIRRKIITYRHGRRHISYKIHYIRKSIKLRHPRRMIFRKRILKGGSWWWYADRLRAAYRRADGPFTGNHRLSIRCGSSTPNIKPLPPKPWAGKRRIKWQDRW